MQKLVTILLFLFALIRVSEAQYQRKPGEAAPKTRILFLLDGSGSMNAKWEGQKRIDIAKEVLSELVDSLKVDKNVTLGLRVYGHQYGRQFQNCKDTKLEAPFAVNNHENIKNKLNAIDPKGVTPLAYSMLQATEDFPESDQYRNVIIIITDGLESCGGDPCKVSVALQRKRIFLKPFIIGLGMEPKYANAFDCIGQFKNAKTIKSFKLILSELVQRSLGETRVRVDLLDSYGKATETNVNMTFLNNMTGTPEYNYVHFIKADGKADELNIDPVMSYDLVVNTIPPVKKSNLFLTGGELNVIKVNTPQGYLQLFQQGYTEYKNLQAIIRKAGSNKTIHVMPVGETEKLLVGDYDIEVLTLPRIYKRVKIEQSKTNRVNLTSPGRVNIPVNKKGYGSIYLIKENGEQEWVYNIPTESSQINMAMQPGNYLLVFKSMDAKGSEHTSVKEFIVLENGSITVRPY